MKQWFLLMSMGILSIVEVAAIPLTTISRAQFGNYWAFTREEVQLRCGKERGLFVINTGTLAQYPLNSIAAEQMRSGKVLGQPLETIWLDDPAHPGEKMSLAPFIAKAEALCQQ